MGWETWPLSNVIQTSSAGLGCSAERGAPVAALFENLKDGASVEQFLEWFPGVDRPAVAVVLDHEVKALANPARS